MSVTVLDAIRAKKKRAALNTPPDVQYDEILRRASMDPRARELAVRFYQESVRHAMRIQDAPRPSVRASDVGQCSLEYITKILGMHTLERDVDTQIMYDTGHLLGAWFASLLKAAAQIGENLWPGVRPERVMLEYEISYEGVSGHIDALVVWFHEDRDALFEPVEFKTTRGTGKVEAPDSKRAGRLYQCLQCGTYALGLNEQFAREVAPRFTIVVHAPNAGKTRTGIPYRKTEQFHYKTSHFESLVNRELDRLRELRTLTREQVLEQQDELADTMDAFRCGGCGFEACKRNTNPMRLEIL